MESKDKLIFNFNSLGDATYCEVVGNISLFTNPKEYMGKNVRDIFPEDIASLTMNAISECIKTNYQQDYEFELEGKMCHCKMNTVSVRVVTVVVAVITEVNDPAYS